MHTWSSLRNHVIKLVIKVGLRWIMHALSSESLTSSMRGSKYDAGHDCSDIKDTTDL